MILKQNLNRKKKKGKNIYDGYKYQLYAQYFGMIERGFEVDALIIHSLVDNKRYPIQLPDAKEIKTFELVLKSIREYDLSKIEEEISQEKLDNCIYRVFYA